MASDGVGKSVGDWHLSSCPYIEGLRDQATLPHTFTPPPLPVHGQSHYIADHHRQTDLHRILLVADHIYDWIGAAHSKSFGSRLHRRGMTPRDVACLFRDVGRLPVQ